MNPNDVIESYVADVIRHVPRKDRNDIGVELRSLLTEMLDERAADAGRPADDAMVLAMLRGFGTPMDIAARYRAPGFTIIPPEETRTFAMLALGGLGLQWAVTLPRVEDGQSLGAWWLTWGLGAFWWPGFLTMMSMLVAWIRHWRKTTPTWSPRDVDPDRVHRGAMVFGVLAAAFGAVMMTALPGLVSQLPGHFARIFAFDPEFLATRAWAAPVLWVAGIVLWLAVIAKGRWTRTTRRIELACNLAWLVVLGWWVADGNIFVAQATNEGAHLGIGIVIVIVLIDMGIKLWRARPRLQVPPIVAQR